MRSVSIKRTANKIHHVGTKMIIFIINTRGDHLFKLYRILVISFLNYTYWLNLLSLSLVRITLHITKWFIIFQQSIYEANRVTKFVALCLWLCFIITTNTIHRIKENFQILTNNFYSRSWIWQSSWIIWHSKPINNKNLFKMQPYFLSIIILHIYAFRKEVGSQQDFKWMVANVFIIWIAIYLLERNFGSHNFSHISLVQLLSHAGEKIHENKNEKKKSYLCAWT
jgi:hypothetical protein